MIRGTHEPSISRSGLDEEGRAALLTALSDPRCRAILAATTEQALSARELAEALSLAMSTVYRKLDHLTTTPLLEEQLRLDEDGKHPHEYRCPVEDIHIDLSDGELEMTIGRPIERAAAREDG